MCLQDVHSRLKYDEKDYLSFPFFTLDIKHFDNHSQSTSNSCSNHDANVGLNRNKTRLIQS